MAHRLLGVWAAAAVAVSVLLAQAPITSAAPSVMIDVQPEAQELQVGATVTLTAYLRDETGSAVLDNRQVRWLFVSGPNAPSDPGNAADLTCSTGSAGECSVSYVAASAGTDVLCAIANGSAVQLCDEAPDAAELDNTADVVTRTIVASQSAATPTPTPTPSEEQVLPGEPTPTPTPSEEQVLPGEPTPTPSENAIVEPTPSSSPSEQPVVVPTPSATASEAEFVLPSPTVTPSAVQAPTTPSPQPSEDQQVVPSVTPTPSQQEAVAPTPSATPSEEQVAAPTPRPSEHGGAPVEPQPSATQTPEPVHLAPSAIPTPATALVEVPAATPEERTEPALPAGERVEKRPVQATLASGSVTRSEPAPQAAPVPAAASAPRAGDGVGQLFLAAAGEVGRVVKPQAVAQVAVEFSFPLALMLAVVLYLAIQGRLDARDPKLRIAPQHAQETLVPFREEEQL